MTNVDEDGAVSFTGEGRFQPQSTRDLEALLSDEDGGVTDEAWQWARSEDGETWADIDAATSAKRSPSTDDIGSYLRASVTYTDSFGSGKSTSSVTPSTVEARTVANAAPSFADQDDDDNGDTEIDGIQVNRSVAENTEAGSGIGKPVSATDADSDVLVYTILDGGTDSGNDGVVDTHVNDDGDDTTPTNSDGDSTKFSIDSASGQIKVRQNLTLRAPQMLGLTTAT